MSPAKKVLSVIGILIIGIQFIRPARNKDGQIAATDISGVVSISDSIKILLHNACYDCHSNNTRYPWYSNIQPAGWLLNRHITDGKDELNFSEFGGYAQRMQLSKLDGIAYNIRENIMPLASYRRMHKNARLSENEKEMLISWTERSIDELNRGK
ncbi:MAG: heme-binding domain-containing protein [Bacteroidales bacterium]|nr:heme-binding domain-containing protein [Bacteroidales bacterium]